MGKGSRNTEETGVRELGEGAILKKILRKGLAPFKGNI
jgi:hypothetical protein